MTKRSRRTWCAAAVSAAAAAGMLAASPPAALAAGVTTLTFPAQAMQGHLVVGPGSSLEAGFAFTMHRANHPAATVTFPGAAASFSATCVSGPGGGTITIPLTPGPYTDPPSSKAWLPSGDSKSQASYQGMIAVPNLCQGGDISLSQGGSFSTGIQSTDGTDKVTVRWHYSDFGAPGRWSQALSAIPASTGPPPPPPQPTQIIVKVDTAEGYTIGDITSAFPVRVDNGGLASRGIYLVSPRNPQSGNPPPPPLQALANQINGYKGVIYAEVNLPVRLADTEFYAWPFGKPSKDGRLPAAFTGQQAASTLQLRAAHAQSKGAGVTVAVLDTGADPVPALHGRLLKGWNYVSDNSDTSDVPTRNGGHVAVGHGTFVSGLIALVAPKARILPEKVLNGNGYGTVYGAAQAILDATAAGAQVINLSFGTLTQPPSSLLQQAVQQAQAAGVAVIAAAGNAATNQQEYPASWPQTLSVAALDSTDSSLASFSDYGGWVDVGAPGEDVVGPMPGGGYATWAGTSMSAPFVSGQAALLRAEEPEMQVNQLFQAIEQTATQLPQNPIHSGAINIVSSLGFASANP